MYMRKKKLLPLFLHINIHIYFNPRRILLRKHLNLQVSIKVNLYSRNCFKSIRKNKNLSQDGHS